MRQSITDDRSVDPRYTEPCGRCGAKADDEGEPTCDCREEYDPLGEAERNHDI